jgi:hypothetical protein
LDKRIPRSFSSKFTNKHHWNLAVSWGL